MAGNKTYPGTAWTFKMSERRRMVADMYLRGKSQTEIAKKAGVSQPTISKDIRYIKEKWLESALIDFNQARANELAKIDRLELEYWKAWESTLGTSKTSRNKVTEGGKDGTKVEASETTRELLGNPAYLAGIQWCIDKRCKLLGLDAPKKIDVSWRDEMASRGIDAAEIFERMVNEYLDELTDEVRPGSE